MLDLAVIIVSWNVRDHLAECLSSVYADLGQSQLLGEVWVVDNGSTDGTLAVLENLFPRTHLIANQRNRGFGAANNQGMAVARDRMPQYYLLLNPDTLVRPKAIRRLVSFLDRTPDAGMVGPRLVYRDGRFQHSAFCFPGIKQIAFDLWPVPGRLYESRLNGRYPRRLFQPDNPPFPIDHPLGAAMLVRRDVAEKTNGFDETFHMYCEEIDWSWRIHSAGWSIYSLPAAEIVHYGGESTKQVRAQSIINLWRSRAHLYHKHHGPATLEISRRLARLGLTQKAKKASDSGLREAYKKAASLWRSEAIEALPHSEIAAG